MIGAETNKSWTRVLDGIDCNGFYCKVGEALGVVAKISTECWWGLEGNWEVCWTWWVGGGGKSAEEIIGDGDWGEYVETFFQNVFEYREARNVDGDHAVEVEIMRWLGRWVWGWNGLGYFLGRIRKDWVKLDVYPWSHQHSCSYVTPKMARQKQMEDLLGEEWQLEKWKYYSLSWWRCGDDHYPDTHQLERWCTTHHIKLVPSTPSSNLSLVSTPYPITK